MAHLADKVMEVVHSILPTILSSPRRSQLERRYFEAASDCHAQKELQALRQNVFAADRSDVGTFNAAVIVQQWPIIIKNAASFFITTAYLNRASVFFEYHALMLISLKTRGQRSEMSSIVIRVC